MTVTYNIGNYDIDIEITYEDIKPLAVQMYAEDNGLTEAETEKLLDSDPQEKQEAMELVENDACLMDEIEDAFEWRAQEKYKEYEDDRQNIEFNLGINRATD